MLLSKLKKRDYSFVRFDEFLGSNKQLAVRVKNDANLERNPHSSKLNAHSSQLKTHSLKLCILRHDVDRRPNNALAIAKLENELGIKSTYYFRIVPESFNEDIIKKIVDMGHEIGYHYEEIDIASRQSSVIGNRSQVNSNLFNKNSTDNSSPLTDDLVHKAYELFKENLAKLRRIADVKTICMHGSPFSKYDNKMLWEKFDYKELGLLGEPYFDIDWNEFGYLTDTGRRWDGESVSVRDKVLKSPESNDQDQKSGVNNSESIDVGQRIQNIGHNNTYRSTFDIITALEKDRFYTKVMINTHPERWNDNFFWWMQQLVTQNIKNVIKKWFFVK